MKKDIQDKRGRRKNTTWAKVKLWLKNHKVGSNKRNKK